MTRCYARFLVALVVAATSGAAQTPTPVALVHGGLSDPSTWAVAAAALQGTGNYNEHEVSSIAWQQILSSQATSMLAELNGIGFGNSAYLVGHSNGGLVSRLASRTNAFAGLITMGTPNQGLPLVDATVSINEYIALLSDGYFVVGGDLADEDACNPDMDNICAYVADATSIMSTVVDLGLIGFEVGLDYAANSWPVWADVSPNSSTILGLEANPGLELASQRGYLQFDDLDEDAGPFRLLYDESDANAVATVVNAYGLELAYDGVNIALLDDPTNDPGYIAHQEAGETLEAMGATLDNFAYTWNQWVAGGFGNDGLVPWSSQPLPNASFSAIALGLAHTEETSDSTDIVALLNQMTGR